MLRCNSVPQTAQSLSKSQLPSLRKRASWFCSSYGMWGTLPVPSREKSRAAGLTCPPFKMYNKATLVKTVCFWPKDRRGIKGVELRAQKYYVMGSFRQGHQDLQWGKNGFSNKGCRENCTSTRRRTYLEPCLPPSQRATQVDRGPEHKRSNSQKLL